MLFDKNETKQQINLERLSKMEEYGAFKLNDIDMQRDLEIQKHKQQVERLQRELKEDIEMLCKTVQACLDNSIPLKNEDIFFQLTMDIPAKLAYIKMQEVNNLNNAFHFFPDGTIKWSNADKKTIDDIIMNVDMTAESFYDSLENCSMPALLAIQSDFKNFAKDFYHYVDTILHNYEVKKEIDKTIDDFCIKNNIDIDPLEKLDLRNTIFEKSVNYTNVLECANVYMNAYFVNHPELYKTSNSENVQFMEDYLDELLEELDDE